MKGLKGPAFSQATTYASVDHRRTLLCLLCVELHPTRNTGHCHHIQNMAIMPYALQDVVPQASRGSWGFRAFTLARYLQVVAHYLSLFARCVFDTVTENNHRMHLTVTSAFIFLKAFTSLRF